MRIMLRFTEEAEVRKSAPPFVPARYTRTDDVVSEVNCVLLRRTRSFKIIALYPNLYVVFEVIACYQGGGKFSIKRLYLAN